MRRSTGISTFLLAVVLGAASCVTDDKGESCGLLDAYSNDAGETYCKDPDAPKDCEALTEALVDSFVECGVSEEEAQATVDDIFDCDTAVATTEDFDKCLDIIEGGCVLENNELPEECKGAILVDS